MPYEQGRALPTPELLQPTLDQGLPEFRPAFPKEKLRGDLRCASSDVLPGLANAWAAKLKEYYPRVNVSVDPPYAGSLGAIELIKGQPRLRVRVARAQADRRVGVPQRLRL